MSKKYIISYMGITEVHECANLDKAEALAYDLGMEYMEMELDYHAVEYTEESAEEFGIIWEPEDE